jgi:hypothetical protein
MNLLGGGESSVSEDHISKLGIFKNRFLRKISDKMTQQTTTCLYFCSSMISATEMDDIFV